MGDRYKDKREKRHRSEMLRAGCRGGKELKFLPGDVMSLMIHVNHAMCHPWDLNRLASQGYN